jgi:hypothetical protein
VRARQPDDAKSLCLALKLYLLDTQMDKAADSLQRLKQIAPGPDITLPWELQINYQTRDWPALHEVLGYLERQCYNDPQFRKIYEFWREPSRRSLPDAPGRASPHPAP